MIANEVKQNLVDVCSSLNRYQVEYLIIGGVAVGYHGYRRISGITMRKPEIKNDLDFWYNPTTSNFIKLTSALVEIGVNKEKLDSIIFDPQKTFLKIPHTGFNTDFLPVMIGVESFNKCFSRSIKDSLDGTEFHIMCYDDLIANKLALNRETDKEDLRGLRNAKNE